MTDENLEQLYVTETSGAFLGIEPPDLSALISGHAEGREYARIPMSLKAISDAEAMNHAKQRTFVDNADQRVIQTATFLFRAGTISDLVVV